MALLMRILADWVLKNLIFCLNETFICNNFITQAQMQNFMENLNGFEELKLGSETSLPIKLAFISQHHKFV